MKKQCLTCHSEFDSDGICCSKDCNISYVHALPLIGDTKLVHRICKRCGTEFDFISRKGGQLREYCSLSCLHQVPQKEKKERPSYCLICKNESPDYICDSHIRADLPFWNLLRPLLNSNSEIVLKEWGFEVHIVNHAEYCLKYLVFFKGLEFSFHQHSLKKECWHCLHGEFEGILEDDKGKKESFWLFAGDKLEIEREHCHQLRALENSILTEVSTTHYDADSKRKIKGSNG